VHGVALAHRLLDPPGMKKQSRKKLSLDRQTIRRLSPEQLIPIRGGLLIWPSTTNCPLSTAACPASDIETRCNCPPPTARGPLCE
jgi:hypothetical protein